MIECCHIENALPWYVSGRLMPEELGDMASHIRACDRCQQQLSQLIQLRHAYLAIAQRGTTPVDRVWQTLKTELGVSERPQLDVGSFLLGLQVGVSAQNSSSPVRGNLRIFGHKVRIIGKHRKENHVLAKQE